MLVGSKLFEPVVGMALGKPVKASVVLAPMVKVFVTEAPVASVLVVDPVAD